MKKLPAGLGTSRKWLGHEVGRTFGGRWRLALEKFYTRIHQWRNFRNLLGGANLEKINRCLKFIIHFYAMINFHFSYSHSSLSPFE